MRSHHYRPHSTSESQLTRLAPLLKSIYDRNSAGCCLHVIVDDGNWDCVIDPDDCVHDDCKQAAEIISDMDMETREAIRHDAGMNVRFGDDDGNTFFEATTAETTEWKAGEEL